MNSQAASNYPEAQGLRDESHREKSQMPILEPYNANMPVDNSWLLTLNRPRIPPFMKTQPDTWFILIVRPTLTRRTSPAITQNTVQSSTH